MSKAIDPLKHFNKPSRSVIATTPGMMDQVLVLARNGLSLNAIIDALRQSAPGQPVPSRSALGRFLQQFRRKQRRKPSAARLGD